LCYTFIIHYFVIQGAVRHCKSTNDSTEAEVISFIKSWLVRCKDRIHNITKNVNNITIEGNNEVIINKIASLNKEVFIIILKSTFFKNG